LTREYFQVPVAEVIRETDEACSLVLDVPASLSQSFLTGRGSSSRCGCRRSVWFGGAMLLAVEFAALGEQPAITVKRTEGGYASNWILDRVRAGTVLDLLPPAGCSARARWTVISCCSPRQRDHPGDVDPEVGAARRARRVLLVYANRDERSVIFSGFAARARFGVRRPAGVVHWLDSLLGVPSAAALAALTRPYAAQYTTGEAFICGPDPYLALVREALGQLRVPDGRVHVERFLSLAENPFEAAAVEDGAIAATLSVSLDGAVTELPWPPGPGCSTCSSTRAWTRRSPAPGHLRGLRLPAHQRRGGDGATTRCWRRTTWPRATSSPARPSP